MGSQLFLLYAGASRVLDTVVPLTPGSFYWCCSCRWRPRSSEGCGGGDPCLAVPLGFHAKHVPASEASLLAALPVTQFHSIFKSLLQCHLWDVLPEHPILIALSAHCLCHSCPLLCRSPLTHHVFTCLLSVCSWSNFLVRSCIQLPTTAPCIQKVLNKCFLNEWVSHFTATGLEKSLNKTKFILNIVRKEHGRIHTQHKLLRPFLKMLCGNVYPIPGKIIHRNKSRGT